jgi:hypothetical protein
MLYYNTAGTRLIPCDPPFLSDYFLTQALCKHALNGGMDAISGRGVDIADTLMARRNSMSVVQLA